MPEIILDFETANAYCDVKVVGSRVYAEHWATEILCLSFSALGSAFLWIPDRPGSPAEDALILAARHADSVFVAHNAGFEKDIWSEIMVRQYGFPPIPPERWDDTQAACALKGWPLSLDNAMPLLLRAKDREGSKLTISLSRFKGGRKWRPGQPHPKGGQLHANRPPAIMERVYAYCANDVADEAALRAHLGPLDAGERRVWLFDQVCNERGMLLDPHFLAGAERIVEAARVPLIAEFRDLTGVEPTQRDRVIEWVQGQGVALPDLTKATISEILGEDAEDADDGRRLGRLPALPVHVRRALAIRALVGSATVRKIARMAACCGHDGRVRRLLQYHGTGPGRWAGRLFNPLNFPRGTVRDALSGKPPRPDTVAAAIASGDAARVVELGLVVEDPPGKWRLANPIEVISSTLRHALIPAAGHKFVVGDFAGIQARTVLALAGQHDKTALMAAGADVYLDMACDIYGVPKGSLDKSRDVEKRQIGKNTVLGCGFQMGAPKFWAQYCPDKPREFAEQVVAAYRDVWAPCVPKLWRGLEEAALRAVLTRRPQEAYGVEYRMTKDGAWLTVRLHDGKLIYYPFPIFVPEGTASPSGREVWKDAWAYRSFSAGGDTWVDAYGGVLTENVVMGIERQLLVDAMLRCEAAGLPVVLNGYDEIVCEVPEARADWKVLEQIMSDPPAWAKALRIPVAAEGWVGDRYRKG